MIWNHYKIFWKTLFRRKLYTAVSLFGICFALTVLSIGVAFYDYLFNPNYPEFKKDRLLCVDKVVMHGAKNGGAASRSGSPSKQFIDNYIKTLTAVEKVGKATKIQITSFYVQNKKFDVSFRYVDLAFLEILDLQFIDGGVFRKEEYSNCSPLAIISETFAMKYFGSVEASISQPITIWGEVYKVKGVVKDVGASMHNSYSDIWLPLSLRKSNYANRYPDILGACQALILAKNDEDLNGIKSEFQRKVETITIYDDHLSDVYARILTATEQILVNKFGADLEISPDGCVEKLKVSENKFHWILGITTLLFILFSVLGLLNVNLNRAYERSSEIGVRRSFGSSKMVLLKQLLLEQLVFTALGGVLSIVFSYLILYGIQEAQFIPGSDLRINLFTLLWSLVFVLLFSFLSGIIPIYKMRKLDLVKSLKSDEL
jgi:putative ABC transport system permease protein